MLSAFGLSNTRSSIINWELYLKIIGILQCHTASREVYAEFWLKFFNLYNLPELPLKGMLETVELLARGCFTKTSTLVSESFATSFHDTLKAKNLIVGMLGDCVDMVRFK
jgi:hypothetical protein